jgi:Domain of unknown function (DUF222)/HNH endonuclease
MGSTDVIARDQVLAELATLGTGTNDAVSLLSQTRDLATFADQVQGELARLAGIVDASGAYAEVGYTSAAAFLRYGCGRSAVRAGELVATGRARLRLRATAQALAEGRVSFDAAHVISRATTQIEDDTLAAAAEQQLLTAATTGEPEPSSPADRGSWVPPGLDPRELRRLGDDLTYRADPDAVEERQRKRFERRYLSFGLTLDDVGTISGACSDALSIEIIKTAVDAFSPPGGGADRRTAAQRRMDGLTAACQAALDSGAAGSRHGAMPHLSILLEEHSGPGDPEHLGTQDHTQSPAGSPARTEHGAMLTARQVLTLACRAEISVIRWKDGLPLNVGRRYRTETPALRRALTARDRGCRWPGCGLPASWCTAHHIRPWKLGGATRLPNLVLLCFVHHHYFIHLLGWTLTGTADALLRFTHPGGWLTLDSPLPAQPASRGP